MKAVTQSVVYMGLSREHVGEVLLRRFAIATCILLTFIYIYFASASVFHAVVQKTTDGQIEESRTELAQLEREFFILSKKVDLKIASNLGLIRAQNKQFITRTVHVGLQ
jgi:hypothetical protein